MSSRCLSLAQHVFVCVADGHAVFLDLRQNQYFCLDRQRSSILQPILMTGQSDGDEQHPQTSITRGDFDNAVIKALLKRRLLVHCQNCGKAIAPENADPPTESLMDSLRTKGPGPKRRYIGSAITAGVLASSWLRWFSIERTVHSVARRKITARKRIVRPCESRIDNLVAVFFALRPYYPREYLCLFDSLALVLFLANYGNLTQLIFGVKMEPFGAHCWVQRDRRILNDTVENVRQYTPIMVV